MLEALPHFGPDCLLEDSLRPEDLRFSPSGRLLALVSSGSMMLMTVDTGSLPIRVGRAVQLYSPSLAFPHGVEFLSEDLIAVAMREGWVSFYRLPDAEAWPDRMVIEPVHELECAWFGDRGATRMSGGRSVRCGPGAVRVQGNRLFVCCNNANTVTEHAYRLVGGTIETGPARLLAQEGLGILDGMTLSPDGRLMAISDGSHHRVVIYRRADMTQACQLTDVDLRYPHGLCFDPSGRSLYVTDAGECLLHVFEGGWDHSLESSTFKLPAVEPDAFRTTKEVTPEQFRHLEGGLKGIDIGPAGVIATTCKNQVLRFFRPVPSAPMAVGDGRPESGGLRAAWRRYFGRARETT